MLSLHVSQNIMNSGRNDSILGYNAVSELFMKHIVVSAGIVRFPSFVNCFVISVRE